LYKTNLLQKILDIRYTQKSHKNEKIMTSVLVFLDCLLSLYYIQFVLDDMKFWNVYWYY